MIHSPVYRNSRRAELFVIISSFCLFQVSAKREPLHILFRFSITASPGRAAPGELFPAIAFIVADVHTVIMGERVGRAMGGVGELRSVIKRVGDCASGGPKGEVGGKRARSAEENERQRVRASERKRKRGRRVAARFRRCGFFLKI